MRKLILQMNMSLDGFVAKPDGDIEWIFPGMGPDQLEVVTGLVRGTDTAVFGRVNYLGQADYWPAQTGELAELLNAHEKIVFSATLAGPLGWNNSTLAAGSPAQELPRLKALPGKDIFASCGARFAQSLSRLGLIDEYHLAVHPIALGAGLPLFADLAEPLQLTLASTTEFASGTVMHVYHAAK